MIFSSRKEKAAVGFISKKERYIFLNELDPQMKALLEHFQANAAQRLTPAVLLSAIENNALTRQMMDASTRRGAAAV
jgi:hypothetical protein